MKYSYLNTRFVALLVLVIPSMLLMNSVVVAHTSPIQDADKSLDIERYPDEPLELVELKIGDKPIKEKIATKWRHDSFGQDTVTFKGQEAWFRHLQVRLRNISGKPISGVGAYLYFRSSQPKTLYSLQLAASTQLAQGVLEPGADITLTVTEQAWSLTSLILKHYDVNADLLAVMFGVNVVQFGDGLQWSKGQILRRDTDNPNTWKPVDKVVPE